MLHTFRHLVLHTFRHLYHTLSPNLNVIVLSYFAIPFFNSATEARRESHSSLSHFPQLVSVSHCAVTYIHTSPRPQRAHTHIFLALLQLCECSGVMRACMRIYACT